MGYQSLLQNVYLFKTMTPGQIEKIAALAHDGDGFEFFNSLLRR